jgi:hypothetical protein
MNTRLIIIAIFLGVAACATSGPEPKAPAANEEGPAANAESNEVEDQLEIVDVPAVAASENVPPPEDEVICHKEKRLGSNRSIKVCRTRAQMDAEREAGQDTLDSLSRRTFSGADRGDVAE